MKVTPLDEIKAWNQSLSHRRTSCNTTVCTPHLGYVEKDSYESLFGAAFDQLLAFAADNRMNVANPEALKRA